MTSIQPELWVDRGSTAVAFYQQAFQARVLHQFGDGEDIVAQLAVDDAVFWIAAVGSDSERLTPHTMGAATGRVLLVVGDPHSVQARAVAAGATEKSPVEQEHDWLLGRIVDPFGHEWEIGHPLGDWPPPSVA
jgi:PhnB protein